MRYTDRLESIKMIKEKQKVIEKEEDMNTLCKIAPLHPSVLSMMTFFGKLVLLAYMTKPTQKYPGTVRLFHWEEYAVDFETLYLITPALWTAFQTTVNIKKSSVRAVEWLSRAGQLPLHISAHIPFSPYTKELMNQLLDTLLAACNNFKRLDIDFSDNRGLLARIASLTPMDVPILRSLRYLFSIPRGNCAISPVTTQVCGLDTETPISFWCRWQHCQLASAMGSTNEPGVIRISTGYTAVGHFFLCYQK